MQLNEIKQCLSQNKVIAAVNDKMFESALTSSVQIIFYLEANLLTIGQKVDAAHKKGKRIFIHLDLADGFGRDRSAVEYLLRCNVDGIITTRTPLIKAAKEIGLFTIQRFFSLDSKGINSVEEVISSSKPDMVEIMPGIVTKIISKFSKGNIPVIAGGLIETEREISDALANGAIAVSTGKENLWK